jgi:hypothetical protein
MIVREPGLQMHLLQWPDIAMCPREIKYGPFAPRDSVKSLPERMVLNRQICHSLGSSRFQCLHVVLWLQRACQTIGASGEVCTNRVKPSCV